MDFGEYFLLAPEFFLAFAAMGLLLLGTAKRQLTSRSAARFCQISLVITGAMLWWVHIQVPEARSILSGMFVIDGFSMFWKVLLLLATFLTVLLSVRYLEESDYRAGEYYSLILFATVGMLFMASGDSLLSIWISLETMALSSYVLAGYFKRELKSNESALKYFVLGALSSGVLLYGISLLYGATGTVQLESLASALAEIGNTPLVSLGWLMLAAGLLFKVAAVPFHVWTPDVYVGAPTPVTAFLAAASKTASFAILVRIFYRGLGGLDWQMMIAIVSVASMIWGNIAALTQTNVKRMLAYSSIAQAGYILIGVLAVNEIGLWAVLFYLMAYVFITMGVFGTVILLERKEYAGEEFGDYAGLSSRAPLLAAMMTLFMLALTGIPPTGGFVGKVYLFAAAVEAGWIWVAVIGVLASAVSLYYYFAVVVQMYFKKSDQQTPVPLTAPALVGAIIFCAIATLALGLIPGPFIEMVKSAALPLP